MKALKLTAGFFFSSWFLGYLLLVACSYINNESIFSDLHLSNWLFAMAVLSFVFSFPLAPFILIVFALYKPWGFTKHYKNAFFVGFGFLLSSVWMVFLYNSLFEYESIPIMLLVPFVVSTTIAGLLTPQTKWFRALSSTKEI